MSTGIDTPVSKTPYTSNFKNVLLELDACLPKEYSQKVVDACISKENGDVIFELKGVEAPSHWSQTAINIAAEKYFARGENPEHSVFDMVKRITAVIGKDALDNKYIKEEDLEIFVSVMNRLLLGQYFFFNSPVWFNVGVHPNPRISACFILGIEDTMESILDNARTEGMIYKYGSGSGCNMSPLRGKNEALSHGGVSSGVLSFVDIGDSVAGCIKSGGTTRRAAKMVILDVDHPDIEDFISCKSLEEKKVKVLIGAGYSDDFRDESGAYAAARFQNANHSVRVTDDFMQAVEEGGKWGLVGRVKSTPVRMVEAKDLFHKIAKATWESGDPGIQFDTQINAWNPLVSEGRINASNPCSEYHAQDNTSCNLASINLLKFHLANNEFDYHLFYLVSYFATVALDVLICNASYPTETISKNVRRMRQIGLGYANLGALLMSSGLAYNSEKARNVAAGITACMTASAWLASADMAYTVGPFEAYRTNKDSVERVLAHHLTHAANRVITDSKDSPGYTIAQNLFSSAYNRMTEVGVRNSYVTNIAPTGTIGFVMDCDTMGIEPELALVKYKKLVGGGFEKLTNRCVANALISLGLSEEEVKKCLMHIIKEGCLDEDLGISSLKDHLDVFECSMKPTNGKNCIPWTGHIKMMAQVQPFLSGSISKTVNLPKEATVADVELAYMMAWKNKLKCIAIYRDGCKSSQPVSANKDISKEVKVTPLVGSRKKLPNDRPSTTHKFAIGGHEGYITVGMYEDGKPGELFIVVSKEGSFVSGLLDSFATMVSIALQYGAPITLIIDKLKGHSFEPQGITSNPAIRFAKSISDYIGRFLELKFVEKDKEKSKEVKSSIHTPPCPSCGSLTTQSGSCHVCSSCGTTTGCS